MSGKHLPTPDPARSARQTIAIAIALAIAFVIVCIAAVDFGYRQMPSGPVRVVIP